MQPPESTPTVCVYMLSGLTILCWITDQGAHARERLILPPHRPLVDCSSRWVGPHETSPFYVSMSIDSVIVQVLCLQLFLR